MNYLEDNCSKCGRPLRLGVAFSNIDNILDEEDRPIFKYMEKEECMHMECYLEHSIKCILEKYDIDKLLAACKPQKEDLEDAKITA